MLRKRASFRSFQLRHIALVAFSSIMLSCSNQTETTQAVNLTAKPDTSVSSDQEADFFEEYGHYFVVIADTGNDYYTLQQLMLKLSRESGIEIDTMGRFYNAEKNLIALPDDDEDEIYAGDYYPRRFPGQSLSLEYLNMYLPESADKTIALVIGIYETAPEADSMLTRLKPFAPQIFTIQSELYLGCMH